MNKEDAYRYVFHHLISYGPKLFIGIYDAKNGSSEFMYGIQTVMEMIAFNVSDETYQTFAEIFTNNMAESLQKGCRNE